MFGEGTDDYQFSLPYGVNVNTGKHVHLYLPSFSSKVQNYPVSVHNLPRWYDRDGIPLLLEGKK